MAARTYVSIQGASFDPSAFEKVAGGSARRRKHSRAPLTDVSLEYWVSAEKTGDVVQVTADLSALLSELVPHYRGLRKLKRILVIAHVIIEVDTGDEPAGMHFSRDVIALLSEIGAALDIDANPKPRSDR